MAPRALLAQGCRVVTQRPSRAHARTLAQAQLARLSTQHGSISIPPTWAKFQLNRFIPLELLISPVDWPLPQCPGDREASTGAAAEPWLLIDAHEAQGQRGENEHPVPNRPQPREPQGGSAPSSCPAAGTVPGTE